MLEVRHVPLDLRTRLASPFFDEAYFRYYVIPKSLQQALIDSANHIWRGLEQTIGSVLKAKPKPYRFPTESWKWIARSWQDREPLIRSRLDFILDSKGNPHFLEINCDQPGGLRESGLHLPAWRRALGLSDENDDNNFETSLLESLETLRSEKAQTIHIALSRTAEEVDQDDDIPYLSSLLDRLNIEHKVIYLEDISWDDASSRFLDNDLQPIDFLWKSYTWTSFLGDPYSRHLIKSEMKIHAPAWTMLLGNKATLVYLSEVLGGSGMLHCDFDPIDVPSVAKPLSGWGGQDIEYRQPGEKYSGKKQVLYQERVFSEPIEGRYVTFSVWVIGGRVGGLLIREESNSIITYNSPFVPFIIE